MRLIFVRHAESVNNVIAKHINRSTHFENGRKSWLTNRKADPKLSQGGRLQAELLSNHVHEVLSKMTRGEPKVLIYTSPMMRALETAEALGKALKGAEIHVDDNLHEIGGKLEKCSIEDLRMNRIGRCRDLCWRIQDWSEQNCGSSERGFP